MSANLHFYSQPGLSIIWYSYKSIYKFWSYIKQYKSRLSLIWLLFAGLVHILSNTNIKILMPIPSLIYVIFFGYNPNTYIFEFWKKKILLLDFVLLNYSISIISSSVPLNSSVFLSFFKCLACEILKIDVSYTSSPFYLFWHCFSLIVMLWPFR